jgi:murein DD-endopeptidase MepM/ murein hydrolase activator NlpD
VTTAPVTTAPVTAEPATTEIPPTPAGLEPVVPAVISPAQRPIWRRSPAIAAAVLLVGIWGADDAYRTLNRSAAASEALASPLVKIDTSALAAGGANDRAMFADNRVSRSKRSAELPKGVASPLPARGDLPQVDPGKTVMGVWVRPSAGGMSSCFCMRWGVMHDGIDLAGPEGSPIVAVGDGVVLEAGPAEGFGMWILIQHSNGDVSLYGHMYSVLVHAGERVVAGQHIADIGANGQSTGPHLHFGVMQGRKDGPLIDPVPWLRARGVDVGSYNPNA